MVTEKTIVNERGGIRLDAALLVAFPTTTRAFVRDAIAAGKVGVFAGDRPLKGMLKGTKLRGGETIVIRELLEECDNLVLPSLERRDGERWPSGGPTAVFEDAALLGFDKPAGMPVQPLSCRETGTLMNAVVTRYPECRSLGDAPLLAGALHRIDADTSGLVLVARSATAFENLREQFTHQTVRKTYLALVEGAVAVGSTLQNELVHDPTLPYCRMIDISRVRANGKSSIARLKPLPAVTAYRPIARTCVENEERTLLEVTIFTGVTHQIRAQLALAGLHIVNDRLYGAFAVENQVGHCLHALAASFRHPLSGDPVEIRTPYPAWATF